MSVLAKIREKSTLLLIIIGGALVAFVLGDVLTSGERLFGGSRRNEVGSVAGQTVSVQEFENRLLKMEENYKMNSGMESIDDATREMLRQQTWNQLLNEVIMDREFRETGITVTSEELYDMVAGSDPHSSVRQAFTDPQTGVFDPSRVLQFLKTMDQDPSGATKQRWLEFERGIKQERILDKYHNLIKKGLYVPKFIAEHDYYSKQRFANMHYVAKRYTEIPDNEITVTEQDLKNYHKKNEKEFEQEKSVKLEYVVFDVRPTREDFERSEQDIIKLKEEFEATKDDTTFMRSYSDAEVLVELYSQDQLPSAAQSLFEAEKGTVVGPYRENNAFRLAKLMDSRMVSDSVRARHILINIQEGDTATAMAKADSLKRLIRGGKKFAELAEKHSEDFGSAQKGGDLDWFTEGMMVKPFNDAVFLGQKGDMPIVVSQFGVHLIEITDKSPASKKVLVAFVEREIEISNKTDNDVYVEASSFASKNRTIAEFNQAVEEKGYNKQVADNVKPGDRTIPGIEQSRELVRWAFEQEEGKVSDAKRFDNKYVVAIVAESREDGVAPLEQVRSRVEAAVIREKKAERFTEEFNTAISGAATIDDVAAKLNTKAEAADNLSFSAFSIPGIGREPKVIGTVFGMPKDQISQPIKGETGVFVIRVHNISQPQELSDLSFYKNQISSNLTNRVSAELFEALKENADVEDFRYKFY